MNYRTPGKLNPCKAIKLDGIFYSDGETPCWEAEIECEQGSAIYAITYGKSAEQAEADARLIAAAPELLEALELTLPRNLCLTNANIPDDQPIPLEFTMGELRKIAAAIAKATAA